MIKSMTAFASIETLKKLFKLGIEIRSYNARYLDISLKISTNYRFMEEKIKKFVADRINRGRIEVIITIGSESKNFYKYQINIPKASAFFESLNILTQKFDLGKINVDTLISAGNIIEPVEAKYDRDELWNIVNECLDLVLSNIDNMKIKEGKNIADDLLYRIDYIENILNEIELKTLNSIELYRNRLKDRIVELTKGLMEINQERIIYEASILAIKSDISEEITRSNSHIKQFRTIMDTNDNPVGKKLNFLLQELSREFNTMGSKVLNSDISHMIVSVKSELEKIREQIQNIE